MPRTVTEPDYSDDRIRSFLRRVRGWGPNTKDLARWQLNGFADWAAGEGVDLYDVELEQLEAFVDKRRAGTSDTVAQGYVQTLRKFYGWAHERGDVDRNPARELRGYKVAETPQRDVAAEELAAMVAACDRRTLLGRRTEAIIELLWCSGIRRGELALLDRASYDTASGVLTVVAPKTGKVRRVAVSEEADDAIDRYLSKRRDADPALFATVDGARLSLESISAIVRDAGVRALGRRVGCHEYRRAFAIWWFENGGSQVGLESAAGWRPGSRMAGRYTRRRNEDLAIAEARRLRAATPPRRRRS